jgi:EmrB/QacA subfamily drug resistance transporter
LTALPSRILVPIIVACALFMENLDATVLATSLPAIAHDMGEDPIALKLALTSYLLSLAVFVPASGWMADRYGAKRIFRVALVIFMLGSIFCGLSSTLTDFVVARIIQGLGGAMMVPVGRLVVLRSVPKSELVAALAWFTIPAIVGPIAGPPLGGFITTYFSWRWIFYINIPIGLLGIVLVTRYIEDIREQSPPPLDIVGLLLLGTGLSGLVFGLAALGQGLVPFWAALSMLGTGVFVCWLYARHAVRTPHPLLDLNLMQIGTFRASIIGGTLFRLGAGATPFLLPLLFQLGFGLTAFASGMLTFVAAIGAFLMKFSAPPILNRFGFRTVLVVNGLLSSVFICVLALFTTATPHAVIIGVLLVGGFFRSLQFSAVNTLIYADIPPPLMSQATSFASAAHQLSLSFGVAVAALTLEAQQTLRGSSDIVVNDFVTAFLVVGVIAAASTVVFGRMPRDAGAELTARAEETVVAADPASAAAHPSGAPG